MYQLTLDVKKQRLDAIVRGKFTEEALLRFNQELREKVKQLHPGWLCTVDLWDMHVLPPELTHYMKESQEIVLGAGVGRMVTLTRSTTLSMQANRLGKQTGANSVVERYYDRQSWEAAVAGD